MDDNPPIDPRDMAELRRRSEMYDKIRALFGSGPYKPRNISEGSRGPTGPRGGAPRIAVVGRSVVCNGRILELARRPMTLRLFRAFCGAQGLDLSREAVIDILHGGDGERSRLDPTMRSPRLTESLYANTVKLISRARILASTHLGQGLENEIDWLVYNHERQSWQLYQIRARADFDE